MKMQLLIPICLIIVQGAVFGQLSVKEPPDDWFHLDKETDHLQGVSTHKMYEFLQGKKSETVVVGVIDSGIDTKHEDLKDVIWVNADEVAGNHLDDDKNGYVDDVHGWNFIGGKDGKDVAFDQLEVTRLYVKYRKKYKAADFSKLSKKEKKEYQRYKELEKTIKEKKEEMGGNVALYGGILEAVENLAKAIGKEDISKEDLDNFQSDDPQMLRAAAVLSNVLENGAELKEFKAQLKEAYDYYANQLNYYYNPDYNARSIVGDNYADPYQKDYGNNDVQGPDAMHGTHVAGIIGAIRNNGLGVNGIADNVRIMSVRAVPDGDERDKDVANAIFYAVNNGASVINMSFGKGYAWDKVAVDKAVKYARKHDVLLVHAAGNSSQNNDETDNFPNDHYRKAGWFKPKIADNWLEVGAISWQKGEEIPASFTNYGKQNVDVFSPGVAIYSTVPDNQYKHLDGTSMAAPVVAGLAAVLRSYYPLLTAAQVKEVIMQSVEKQHIKVKKPGTDELVPFSELSQTGGVVNGYNAVRLADKTVGKKKQKKGRGSHGGKGSNKKKSKVVIP